LRKMRSNQPHGWRRRWFRSSSPTWARPPPIFVGHDLVRKPVPTFRDHALNRHRAFERGLIEIGTARRIDHLPAIHDKEVVAQLVRKIEILLDENDGDFPEIAQILDRAAD